MVIVESSRVHLHEEPTVMASAIVCSPASLCSGSPVHSCPLGLSVGLATLHCEWSVPGLLKGRTPSLRSMERERLLLCCPEVSVSPSRFI